MKRIAFILVLILMIGVVQSALAADEYAIKVFINSGGKKTLLKEVHMSEIKALPVVKLEADGKPQQGTLLKNVLHFCGVDDYKEVTVIGAWKEVYTLQKGQVTDRVVLDAANRGTMKLSSPDIPKDQWVRDVAEIDIAK